MVFVSFEYAILLAVVTATYWLLPARFAMASLMVASIVFYASWSVPYLLLVGTSIFIGYVGAIVVERQRSRGSRSAMVLVTLTLLGLLSWFKYADFGLEIWGEISGGPVRVLDIVLPLAISFYTFQILGYVIDVHRGTPAVRSPFRFALFVSFFPQMIAGPIARGSSLIPQLLRRPSFDAIRILRGLELIALGVVKKVVVADSLAVFVDRVYGDPAGAGGLDAMVASLAFGAQIYCDFSGYTDIARGSGRLFGIELPENFRSPYLSGSITEFWRRWHITLSTWLRDYLYIPLGGNRRGRARLYANLLITMGLGGLWHGASATFVLWGLYPRRHPGRGALARAGRRRVGCPHSSHSHRSDVRRHTRGLGHISRRRLGHACSSLRMCRSRSSRTR